MRKYMWALMALAMVIACQPKKYGAFVVTGTIQNAPGNKVLLVETPYGESQPVVLDSTELGKKGEFTLRGRANEEGVFRLVIDKGPDVIIVNDNSTIRLELDVNNYSAYKIQGSPASEGLHTLFDEYRTIDSSIFSNFKIIDSLKSIPGRDSIVEVMRTQNDTRVVQLNDLVTRFIENSSSPAASLYAFGIASQTLPLQELQALVETSAKKFPEHTGIARIKSVMAMKMATPAKPEPANTYKLMNQQAPDLTMNDLNGRPVSIKDFRGKYLLVDFWASWCGPCRQENPNVVAAWTKYKNHNFAILGVSLDQDKDDWKNAVQKDNLTWSHMSDLKYWESAAVAAYGFDGIPFNVLVDPSGKIIAAGLRGADLDNMLSQVLK